MDVEKASIEMIRKHMVICEAAMCFFKLSVFHDTNRYHTGSQTPQKSFEVSELRQTPLSIA
jgi:hypothetical protein